jgi:cell division protein YceG involved in septum cleavage
MKSIAVLTDFSEKSGHAAKYALHIAKKMKVNIKLYHLQLTPAALYAQAVLSEQEYPEEPVIDTRLAEFSEALAADFIKRVFPGSFMPDISFYTGSADMVDVMTEIINNSDNGHDCYGAARNRRFSVFYTQRCMWQDNRLDNGACFGST